MPSKIKKVAAKHKLIRKSKNTRKQHKIKPIKTLQLYYDNYIPTKEDLFIKSILSKKKAAETTEYSMLFNSVLSAVTPGLRNLYYKSGISVGRVLYRVCNNEKHYTWYEESVADLVRFLELSGFERITYNIYPDRIDIKFHNRDSTALSINTHVFESGIISGFLTAGKQQYVKVEEITCSNNNSRFCHFITSNELPLYLEPAGKDMLDAFAYSIKDHMDDAHHKRMFSEEYYTLSSSVLLDSEYSNHMQRIIRHMGSQMAPIIGIKKLNRSSSSVIERVYLLLGLGTLKVRSINPTRIEIQFKGLKAKKEFVDISIAFLSGLLRDAIKGKSQMDSSVSRRGNSYIANVTESKR